MIKYVLQWIVGYCISQTSLTFECESIGIVKCFVLLLTVTYEKGESILQRIIRYHFSQTSLTSECAVMGTAKILFVSLQQSGTEAKEASRKTFLGLWITWPPVSTGKEAWLQLTSLNLKFSALERVEIHES